MIILDTNIITEMMKNSPSERVAEWLDQQNPAELHITTITIAEISYAINHIDNDEQQKIFVNAFNKVLQTCFTHRILPFNELAAQAYGKLMQRCQAHDNKMSVVNGQVAAIAFAQKAVLATKQIHDFANCNIDLINPFAHLDEVEILD